MSYQSGLRFSSERRQNQGEREAGVMRAAEEIGARNTRTGYETMISHAQVIPANHYLDIFKMAAEHL